MRNKMASIQSISQLKAPLVILNSKHTPEYNSMGISVGDSILIRCNNLLDSFSPQFINAPKTEVFLKTTCEFLVYILNNKPRGWIIDSNYLFYKIPLGLSVILKSYKITKESNNLILAEDAPYMLFAPYFNADNYTYVTVLVDKFHMYAIGYTEIPLTQEVVKI